MPSQLKEPQSSLIPRQLGRHGSLAPKVVYVDGQPGCGKTMISPIVAALDRVEKLTFAYETEYTCAYRYLNQMSLEAASNFIQLSTDLQIYNLMMARDTNFRPSDLSSIFRDVHPMKYLKRMFRAGDTLVPEQIQKGNPILHLTTHNLLSFSEPVFKALGSRAVMIELVRHPLYMIRQQSVNMETIMGTVRDLTVYHQFEDEFVPYYTLGIEKEYLEANPVERAAICIANQYRRTEKVKKELKQQYNASIVTIPFEHFVLEPESYLSQMAKALDSEVTPMTRKMLAKQKVPRAMIADGLDLKIYRRFGWQPSQAQTEAEELKIRRDWVKDKVSARVLKVLDECSAFYEEEFLKGKVEVL